MLSPTDLHGMVQQSPAEGRHWHREHRRGFPQRAEADAAAGSHLRRDPAQARPRQDAIPQDRERQQGARLHRFQRYSFLFQPTYLLLHVQYNQYYSCTMNYE